MDRTFVTIVSGLPRSGTSMMMQMLVAGGLEAMTDQVRQADDDNPKGYFEFEPVKKTKDDPSWLGTAGGKVVKMIYRLLYDLPTDREYRVVFMRRDIEEILASQAIMLERRGQDGAKLTPEQLAKAFQGEVDKFDAWIGGQDAFSILNVNYKQAVSDPMAAAEKVNAFLGGDLDSAAMAGTIDPDLYRNRA
ncbi:MAG: sulfotransferase family protein [Planctomycetota bacterium]|jgi:hypothetical protein